MGSNLDLDPAPGQAAGGELLSTGNLLDGGFKAAEATLGLVRLVEVIHTIGHFSTAAMMANVVGATPAADAVSRLKG